VSSKVVGSQDIALRPAKGSGRLEPVAQRLLRRIMRGKDGCSDRADGYDQENNDAENDPRIPHQLEPARPPLYTSGRWDPGTSRFPYHSSCSSTPCPPVHVPSINAGNSPLAGGMGLTEATCRMEHSLEPNPWIDPGIDQVCDQVEHN